MFEFLKKLPHCDTLFKRYFDPWYNKQDQRSMTRPDVYTISAFDGKSLDIDSLQYLEPECLEKIKGQVDGMIKAAKIDFQSITSFKDFSVETLDIIDKHYSRDRIKQLIKESEPSDYSNPYLVTVCLFGSMLGDLFTRQPDYSWLYSYPYFNSIVVHSPTGTGVTVYDWAIKKFSSYGVDDGFAAKFKHAINQIPKSGMKGICVSTY